MFFLLGPGWLLLIPALLLATYAQWKVRSTFNKYASLQSASRMTAGQIARNLLDHAGLGQVNIEPVAGTLTDHYDPRNKVLRLSASTSRSVAAIGVAAHETGHAIQHARGYRPLVLRSAIVPVVGFGSNLAFPLFIAGLLFRYPPLMTFGIIAFSLAVLFTLVTLPVEFDASRRAVKLLHGGGYVTDHEERAVREVLNAAALTYVASAAMAAVQLVRMILLSRSR
ncbi:MAG: zinc metallopeptidase [Candidatus Bipolaricaulia bacterium]